MQDMKEYVKIEIVCKNALREYICNVMTPINARKQKRYNG